jgi:tetratricopeptide (TPR) repeat protein
VSDTTTRRDLDPDALAALEEERTFLLRSLDDLEREHEAGDVDDVDYETLKDDYTARAARAIRAIESHNARRAAARRPRSWRRLALTVAGVVAFAALAGVLMADAAGRREAGGTLTGDVRETTRAQLDQAVSLAGDGNYTGAIAVYDKVLRDHPDNVEALTFKGWFQWLSGNKQGVVTLVDAAELDRDFPATHAFLAVIFDQLDRPDTAREEIRRLDALDPPPEFRQLTAPVRARLGLPTTPAPASPTTTAPGG